MQEENPSDYEYVPNTPPPIPLHALSFVPPPLKEITQKRKAPGDDHRVRTKRTINSKEADYMWSSAAFLHHRKRAELMVCHWGMTLEPEAVIIFGEAITTIVRGPSCSSCPSYPMGTTYEIIVIPRTGAVSITCMKCEAPIPDNILHSDEEICSLWPPCVDSSHDGSLSLILEDQHRPTAGATEFKMTERSRVLPSGVILAAVMSGDSGLADLMVRLYKGRLRYNQEEDQFEILSNLQWEILTNKRALLLVEQQLRDQFRWMVDMISDELVRTSHKNPEGSGVVYLAQENAKKLLLKVKRVHNSLHGVHKIERIVMLLKRALLFPINND